MVSGRRSGGTPPSWIRTARRPILRALTSLGPRVLPQGDHIVFVSAHANDPDALVILEYLARHSERPLVWIAPQLPDLLLLDEAIRPRISARRQSDFAGLWAFLTSRLVFHTYGVYVMRQAHRRQVIVNVWHGDGPKRMRPHPLATSFMVTGIEEFGQRRMAVLGLPVHRLLVTGRPRVDDLHRGLPDAERCALQTRLGLDERPIVWWLPTWREKRELPRSWGAGMGDFFTDAAFSGVRDRYQFVVKPHSMNPEQEWPDPWVVITSGVLEDSHVRWYRLLGCAAAILTDYSSVWTDFLHTSVPIGFVTPDVETYAAERGFYMENWRDLLPGPSLSSGDALREFLSNLDELPDADQRAEIADILGSRNTPGATSRLMQALRDRGADWM